LLEKVPATKKLKDAEGHLARERVLDNDEYKGVSPRWLQRIIIGHSRGSVHQRYINPPDEEMFKIFAQRLGWKNVDGVFTEELRPTAESAK
jgi:hypothetical protein